MRGKKPTRKQAEFLAAHRLNYENWLIRKDTPTEMVAVHRKSGKEKILRKGA